MLVHQSRDHWIATRVCAVFCAFVLLCICALLFFVFAVVLLCLKFVCVRRKKEKKTLKPLRKTLFVCGASTELDSFCVVAYAI